MNIAQSVAQKPCMNLGALLAQIVAGVYVPRNGMCYI